MVAPNRGGWRGINPMMLTTDGAPPGAAPTAPPLEHGGFTPGEPLASIGRPPGDYSNSPMFDVNGNVMSGPNIIDPRLNMGVGGIRDFPPMNGMEGSPFNRGPVMGVPQRPPGISGFRGLLGGFPGFGGGSFGGGMPFMGNPFGGGFNNFGGGFGGFGGGGFPGFGGGFPGFGGGFMPQQNMFSPGFMQPWQPQRGSGFSGAPWMGMGMNTSFSPSANMFQNQMMRSQMQTPTGFFGFRPPSLPQLPVDFWGAPAPQPGQMNNGGSSGASTNPNLDPYGRDISGGGA